MLPIKLDLNFTSLIYVPYKFLCMLLVFENLIADVAVNWNHSHAPLEIGFSTLKTKRYTQR